MKSCITLIDRVSSQSVRNAEEHVTFNHMVDGDCRVGSKALGGMVIRVGLEPTTT